jgi:catechol 2,3-dioxygenase-like lactoylglutathione lyase family enzyme
MGTSVLVRYIVRDVDSAVAFYTERLGFSVVMRPAPLFAMLSRDALRLALSAPGGAGGGGQAMPDGTKPTPGGWNRFVIEVDDLTSMVDSLRQAGVRMRSDIIHGTGGDQIILEDPSGNPVELFQSRR